MMGAQAPVSVRSARSRMPRFSLGEVLGWGASLGVLALVLIFRPPTLGGTTNYVFVAGVSMQPTMHTGDLAILRPADTYAIGDIVAYRPVAAPEDQIIHRIVGIEPDGAYIVKGDNVSVPDFDKPRASDLLGRTVLWIPMAGWLLASIGTAWGLGAIAAVVAMAITWRLINLRSAPQTTGSVTASPPDGPAADSTSSRYSKGEPA